jgi:hypothetical protein
VEVLDAAWTVRAGDRAASVAVSAGDVDGGRTVPVDLR